MTWRLVCDVYWGVRSMKTLGARHYFCLHFLLLVTTETQICPDGQYGPNCGSKCFNCAVNNSATPAICDSVDGKCIHGCIAGYTGSFCNKVCPALTFGPKCVNHCSDTCGGNKSCHATNGTCSQGCVKGYRGDTCQNKQDQDEEKVSTPLAWIIIGVVVAVATYGCIAGFIIYHFCSHPSGTTVREATLQQSSTVNDASLQQSVPELKVSDAEVTADSVKKKDSAESSLHSSAVTKSEYLTILGHQVPSVESQETSWSVDGERYSVYF